MIVAEAAGGVCTPTISTPPGPGGREVLLQPASQGWAAITASIEARRRIGIRSQRLRLPPALSSDARPARYPATARFVPHSGDTARCDSPRWNRASPSCADSSMARGQVAVDDEAGRRSPADQPSVRPRGVP